MNHKCVSNNIWTQKHDLKLGIELKWAFSHTAYMFNWRINYSITVLPFRGVGGTVVSTHAFHPCDPGSIPAQCSYQIKIPPWSHVRRVFPVWLCQTPQLFSGYSGFLLYKCLQRLPPRPMRDGPNWTSGENSIFWGEGCLIDGWGGRGGGLFESLSSKGEFIWEGTY